VLWDPQGHVATDRNGPFAGRRPRAFGPLAGHSRWPTPSGQGYVVQGVKLDDDTRAQLRDLAHNEDGVFVPAAVLDRLRDL
jgi:hypothetical protein